MVVLTRWSYKRGGRKKGFHCIFVWFSSKIAFCFIIQDKMIKPANETLDVSQAFHFAVVVTKIMI